MEALALRNNKRVRERKRERETLRERQKGECVNGRTGDGDYSSCCKGDIIVQCICQSEHAVGAVFHNALVPLWQRHLKIQPYRGYKYVCSHARRVK